MSRKILLGLVAAAGAVTFAFLVVVMVRQGLDRAGAWAAPLATLAGIIAAIAAVYGPMGMPSKVPLPPELEVPSWVVGRPGELAAVVKMLVSGRIKTVGITTGLHGAGGFGKTTLAQMVCADRGVRRRFRGRVYLVTVGRDVRGAAAISAKVNDVIKLVTGEDAAFTDPQIAGQWLGSLLDARPRRLLVLDDVWEPEQLAPFVRGGKRCARLVTTRVPHLLAGRGVSVLVDQMSPDQACALLTSGLPQLDPAVAEGLLAVTGRWPLLLRLVNRILADYARVAPDVSAQGSVLLKRLRTGGPAIVDDLLGNSDDGLDVDQPEKRAQAVRATIEASTSLLEQRDADRFAELGVFVEDETISFSLMTRLWRATAGITELETAQVCKRLAQLALVSEGAGSAHGITLHDVIRDFLRAELGQHRLARLNCMLIDEIAATLPATKPLNPEATNATRVAWWELGREDRYLWEHLIEHFMDAARPRDAENVVTDLRWVGARLERFGPAAPTADLSAVATPRAARLRAVLLRVAHLLAPTEPTAAVVDILHSRIAGDLEWGPQVVALRDICPPPRLVNRWPLPDLADPALRSVLVGHTAEVWSLGVSPDGNWLASGSWDGTVRIWDLVTEQERASLTGHTRHIPALALAVAPDGIWLATGSTDKTVRIWDVTSRQKQASLTGHAGAVGTVAIAPDSSWLAAGEGRVIRIWDVATGQERAILIGHTDQVAGVAVAPDGSWLASGSWDGTVRIWDLMTGQVQATLTGHAGRVRALAVAPDGVWLASGGDDETVRIWDVATGQERAILTGHTDPVRAVVVAPDSSWLASGSWDGTVRIWDLATGQAQATLTGHAGRVWAVVVAPDSSWLASGGDDGTVRIWDVAITQERASLASHTGHVTAIAVASDGSWLAASEGQVIRIWDMATGHEQISLTGYSWIAPASLEALACRIRLTYHSFLLCVVVFLIFFRRNVLASGVQALGVIPVDPFQGREHDIIGPAPRPFPLDELFLVKTVQRLGRRIIIRLTGQ